MMDVVLVSVERWYGEYFQGGIGGHHDLSEARDVLNLVMEKWCPVKFTFSSIIKNFPAMAKEIRLR